MAAVLVLLCCVCCVCDIGSGCVGAQTAALLQWQLAVAAQVNHQRIARPPAPPAQTLLPVGWGGWGGGLYPWQQPCHGLGCCGPPHPCWTPCLVHGRAHCCCLRLWGAPPLQPPHCCGSGSPLLCGCGCPSVVGVVGVLGVLGVVGVVGVVGVGVQGPRGTSPGP